MLAHHMQNSILQAAWNLHISAVVISLIDSIIRKDLAEESKKKKIKIQFI